MPEITYNSSGETGGNLVADKTDLQAAVKEVRDFANTIKIVNDVLFDDIEDAGVVSVPFDYLTTNIPQKIIDAQYDYQPNTTGAVDSYEAKQTLIANGNAAHIPTFSGFEKWPNSDDWDNTLDAVNKVAFMKDEGLYYYTIVNGSVASSPTQLNQVTLNAETNITNDGFTINWNDTNIDPQESSYLIEIDTVDTFDSGNYATTTAAQGAISKALTGLGANTQWFYRITAVGNGSTTSDSPASATGDETTSLNSNRLFIHSSEVYNTGSTPATNGETVETWGDQSVNNLDATQTTEADKPTYSDSGELVFDDDHMNVPVGNQNPEQLTIILKVRVSDYLALGRNEYFISHRSGSIEFIAVISTPVSGAERDVVFQIRGSGNAIQQLTINNVFTNNSTYHSIIAQLDRVNNNHKLYVDGITNSVSNTYDFTTETISSTKKIIGGYDSGSGNVGLCKAGIKYVEIIDGVLSDPEISAKFTELSSI